MLRYCFAVQPGDVVGGRFIVQRFVGAGGMGTVYYALDREHGVPVALKVLAAPSEDSMQRFDREARLLADLDHAAIVKLIARGNHAATSYFAMEWLDGEDLAARLRRRPLTVRESIDLVSRAAEALSTVHERGIVHRDIKPSNLMLRDGDLERVTLVDFGIARDLRALHAMTRTGAILGTLGYLAPEQARGDREITPAADVFSLGCVLFECLTGRRAFASTNAVAVLATILVEDAPPLAEQRADLPAALGDLIARTLSKRAHDRPATARELATELAAFADTDGPPPVRGTSTSAQATTPRRELLFATVSLVGPAPGSGASETIDPNATVADESGLIQQAARAGAACTVLADGSLLFVFGGSQVATDRAALAAGVALSFRATYPERQVVLATGRTDVNGKNLVGEAIDRAVSLLAHATGQIEVDEVTAGLLDARFEISAGQLVGQRPAQSERRLLGRATTCVGRDRELNTLETTCLDAFSTRTPAGMLLIADAGIGKSRLQFEVARRLAARVPDVQIWRTEGTPLSAGSPLAMIATLVRRLCNIADDDTLGVRRDKLVARVGHHVATDSIEQVAAFLGELIGVRFDAPLPDLAAARIEPALLVREIHRAWDTFISAETAAHPVLLVLEDLHWGDRATIDRVDAALGSEDRALSVLALARPSVTTTFGELWSTRGIQELRLRELPRRACIELARQALGDVGDALLAAIADRCSGNAFFLEEIVRSVATTPPARANAIELPESALAMLTARLAHLSSWSRQVLGAASVLGETFWAGAVASLLDIDHGTPELTDALHLLADEELVERTAESRFRGELQLRFRHALVREAAYGTLDADARIASHDAAGLWLERQGEPDLVVLAHHFERAARDNPTRARAAMYLNKAAVRALHADASQAGLELAERGLVVANQIDDPRTRASVELGLQFAVGQAIAAMRGFAPAEVQLAFRTGLAIAERIGAPAVLLQALNGIFGIQGMTGQYEAALATSERALTIATQLGEPHLLLEAHHTAWLPHLLLGNFTEARRHIEIGLGLFDAASTREVGVISGVFPEVHCLMCLTALESLCGSPDLARDVSHRAIALATAKRHGFSLGAALIGSMIAAAVLDDIVWYRDCALRALAVGQKQQMQWIEGLALIGSGYATARDGNADTGLASIESGIEILRAIGAVMFSGFNLTLKAEVLMMLGRLEEARLALASATEFEAVTGEIVLRPLRLCALAELERLAGDRELAASHLRTAIEDSQTRGSRSLEIRATTALTSLGA